MALKFFNTVLRRLCFQLTCRLDIGDQGDVKEQAVRAANVMAKLADRLQERQAFDVTNSPANFTNNKVFFVQISLDEVFDFIGNVRNNLDGRP